MKFCNNCGFDLTIKKRGNYCSSKCYYEKNPKVHERAKEKQREYYRKPEVQVRLKEYNQRAYVKAKKRECDRKYSKRPEVKKMKREYGKDYRKKYSQTEHGRLIINGHNWKRRAMLSNVIHDFTIKEWLEKRNNTCGICPDCKRSVGINKLTLDHIYSIKLANDDYERTGEKRRYAISDVQPLCGGCNSGKGMKVIIK